MQIEVTRKSATTFMRWVIVLTLFGTVIYQSNRIEELKHQLDSKNATVESLHKDWAELNREYAELSKSCPK